MQKELSQNSCGSWVITSAQPAVFCCEMYWRSCSPVVPTLLISIMSGGGSQADHIPCDLHFLTLYHPLPEDQMRASFPLLGCGIGCWVGVMREGHEIRAPSPEHSVSMMAAPAWASLAFSLTWWGKSSLETPVWCGSLAPKAGPVSSVWTVWQGLLCEELWPFCLVGENAFSIWNVNNNGVFQCSFSLKLASQIVLY